MALTRASTISGLRLRREMGRPDWAAPLPYGPDGWAMKARDGNGTILVSVAPEPDGHDWVHASMTRKEDVPTYWDLKALHAAVFNGWAYQLFAPPIEHVNDHEHCLHLFGRLDGRRALPDFTHGSGHI